MSTLRLPGLIDVHVHLRDPGGTHKEDFATGTAAALAGGIVAVLDMPNNSPPVINAGSLRAKQAATEKAHCDYGLYLGATENNAAAVARLHDQACGLKMYLGQTYGPLRLVELSAVMAHFREWPARRPIAIHAEGLALAGVIALAQAHNQPVHLCHVSRAAEIALIHAAKERGAPITCEVTPHHLFSPPTTPRTPSPKKKASIRRPACPAWRPCCPSCSPPSTRDGFHWNGSSSSCAITRHASSVSHHQRVKSRLIPPRSTSSRARGCTPGVAGRRLKGRRCGAACGRLCFAESSPTAMAKCSPRVGSASHCIPSAIWLSEGRIRPTVQPSTLQEVLRVT